MREEDLIRQSLDLEARFREQLGEVEKAAEVRARVPKAQESRLGQTLARNANAAGRRLKVWQDFHGVRHSDWVLDAPVTHPGMIMHYGSPLADDYLYRKYDVLDVVHIGDAEYTRFLPWVHYRHDPEHSADRPRSEGAEPEHMGGL